jgi:hypothetical protein
MRKCKIDMPAGFFFEKFVEEMSRTGRVLRLPYEKRRIRI